MSGASGYYHHPEIRGNRIVFVSEDDLWEVATSGGLARRLTAAGGFAGAPRLSPDGAWLAFTGRFEGSPEIYVMPAAGGAAQRLTWLGASLLETVCWSPRGDAVIFASTHGQPFGGVFTLASVPRRGGTPAPIACGPARMLAFEPKGKGRVIAVNSGDPARWKRYRGGRAGQLWIDLRGRGTFTRLLPELAGDIASPMWIGERVWFLSDHEGHGNLYSVTPRGTDLVRHTHHEEHYVRFPATDGERIVYQCGADLFLLEPRAGARPERVAIELASARPGRERRFVPASRWLEEVDVHPGGHSLATTVRGGIYTFGLWEGAPERHGEVSSVRYRLARWLADGAGMVSTGDEGGEESLVVWRPGKRPRRIAKGLGRVLDLEVAPGKPSRAAATNHRLELWVIDLDSGRARLVERSTYDRIAGIAWSPDGRYLAYGLPTSRHSAAIRVHDLARKRSFSVTSGEFRDASPAWDPRGRFLSFVSYRIFDPVYDTQNFDLGFPAGGVPCIVPLAASTPSPFSLAQSTPRSVTAKKPKSGDEAPVRITIDFDEIAARVIAVPVREARYTKVGMTAERIYYAWLPVAGALGSGWRDSKDDAGRLRLAYWDINENEQVEIEGSVSDFAIGAHATALVLRSGNRVRVLDASTSAGDISSSSTPGRKSGWIDLDRLNVEVQPGLEWRQMLREIWRLQRDQFWNAQMSSVDWQAIHDRYLPLVDRVGSRSEFSDLVWELQGELGTSHCYEIGGDYRPSSGWHLGFLGADLAPARGADGGVVVKRIPRGDSWLPEVASPLAAPGVDVREGDVILAVSGRALGRHGAIGEHLVNQARRPVSLLVRRGRSRPRQVVVECLASETDLRYRDWVESNRERVHARSRGRVGYVHIPDMGPRGFAAFHRYYRLEVDRDGLVIDVRFNGGGHVSQLLLEKLARKRLGYDYSRWMAPQPYPDDSPMGAIVALTNERAGSDGDIFSHCFKLLGLGPLIGKRTWGGVVGIWPRHWLVDGTVTTQPEFSFWFHDVGWGVENYGTDPDIEVEITPHDHVAGRDPQLDRAIDEAMSRLGTRRGPPPPAPIPNLAAPRLDTRAAGAGAKRKPRRR